MSLLEIILFPFGELFLAQPFDFQGYILCTFISACELIYSFRCCFTRFFYATRADVCVNFLIGYFQYYSLMLRTLLREFFFFVCRKNLKGFLSVFDQ